MTAAITPAPCAVQRCGLLAPLTWPAAPGTPRWTHRILAALADLHAVVSAGHELAADLAALSSPPPQGWTAAMTAIDVAAVDSADPGWLRRQLVQAGMTAAAEHLQEALTHRLAGLQPLRAAIRANRLLRLDQPPPPAVLAGVVDQLDQAGRRLAAADQALIAALQQALP